MAGVALVGAAPVSRPCRARPAPRPWPSPRRPRCCSTPAATASSSRTSPSAGPSSTTAEQALDTARGRAAAARATVGTAAAGLYRQGAAERFPVLDLSVTDPARNPGVLHAAALAELADRDLQGAVVRAQRSDDDVQQAQDRVTEARTAVATATARASAALADTRAQVGTLGAAVAAQLAALGGAAGQTADQQALRRWQDYLAGLAAAGIEPPPAAALADPDAPPRRHVPRPRRRRAGGAGRRVGRDRQPAGHRAARPRPSPR